MKKTITLILSVAALVTAANAQQGSVTVVSPNGGLVNVPVFVQPGLGDIARGGNGAVLVDPQLLSMPWEFRQFVLAHEAAHAIGIMNETAADYFGGQNLRIAGFTPAQMQVVFASMNAFLGAWGDATHLPAQQRIKVVWAAYKSAGT
jgi:hypothetical protein